MRDHAPPDDPRRTVLSRLRELEAAEVVDDVSVRIWEKSIPASPDELDVSASLVHDRIAEFQQWADRNGHSLEPAFRWCEQSTMVSEEQSEVIRLPLQCLAVYEDDQLVGVFPCTGDQGTTRSQTVSTVSNRVTTVMKRRPDSSRLESDRLPYA